MEQTNKFMKTVYINREMVISIRLEISKIIEKKADTMALTTVKPN